MHRLFSFFSLLLLLLFASAATVKGANEKVLLVSEQSGGFALVHEGKAAAVCVSPKESLLVRKVAGLFADDVQRVSGMRPEVRLTASGVASSVIIATIGHNAYVDKLVRQGKLDVSAIKGGWEQFVVKVVDGRLLIVGSDRRGAAYGTFTLSEEMGISPWYWWADVPTESHSTLFVDADYVSETPTVKYRGIFINDEDWGLKPWASENYERELGDIGPRTYARVCELLLRLKANMLAPAMHSCTGAFYSHPESKVVCDSFGIVITTSHCEPLLLNNAADSEWNQDRDGDWNYKTNSKTIYKKWDDRLREAARYENIYTVAMRGVHDAGLRGDLPMNERVPLIEKVIADQRGLLTKHKAFTPQKMTGEVADVPQIFVPYKETMDIYENGLRVPDDITLVWVDDNYGYMKRVSSPDEQQRKGRAGVYYHLSYLGAPHDYLWLNTTPPVLMYEELKKAYDHGADRYWLLNVGDIKPMELGMTTFFGMAWNLNDFDIDNVNCHQAQWLSSLFPADVNGATSKVYQEILDNYYRLAWSRKPEYMGWEYEWDDKEHTGLKNTEFSFVHYDEAQRRLADYQWLSDAVERMAGAWKEDDPHHDAFFELVQFPVQAACQMNRKFLMAQLNRELKAEGRAAEANWAARQMELAFDSIETLCHRYNGQADGKWQHFMTVPPGFCALYQEKPDVVYTQGAGERAPLLAPYKDCDNGEGCHVIDLARFVSKSDDARLVTGLGYDWQVMQLGSAAYSLPQIDSDSVTVVLYTVPFWPLYKGKSNAVSIDLDGKTQLFENRFREYDRSWKDQVMRNGATCRLRFPIDRTKAGHLITFTALEPGQMLQRVIIDWGGLQPSYLGPQPSK